MLAAAGFGHDRRIRLKATPEAPYEARREFVAAARHWLPDDALVTGRLLVSELVTNTVRHGDCQPDDPIDLLVERSPRGVRVEVCQLRPVDRAGIVRDRHDDREGGFGLALVEDLAAAWGVQPDPPCVWFELAA